MRFARRMRAVHRELAAHVVGRAAPEDVLELRRAGERVRLVDAPGEARAVEAASGADAEQGLGELGGAAPDVRVADERDGALEDVALPGREGRKGEGLGERGDGVALPVAQVEQLGERVRGFRARGDVLRPELAAVVDRCVVEAKAEEPCDHLRAEALRRGQPGLARLRGEEDPGVAEAGGLHERTLELPHHHGPGAVDDDLRLAREIGDRLGERLAGERLAGPERRHGRPHQAVADDRPNLWLRPGGGGGGGRCPERENDQDRGNQTPSHPRVYRRVGGIPLMHAQ